MTGSQLGYLAARGALTTTGGQLVRLAIQTVSVVVLARLLQPSDYGLLAMVIVITGVGEVVRDFGLSAAAIQVDTLTKTQRDNLFWINTGIGATFTALTLLLANPLAWLYREPRLSAIASALAVSFLFNGISTQYRASLGRHLKFGLLAVIDTTAFATGLVVGITMAVLGRTYWALVGQQLAISLSALILVVVFGRWVPRWYSRGTHMRLLLKFGGNLTFSQLLTYCSGNVDSIVVGGAFGPSSLGLYSRAFQLLTLSITQFNAPATKVAVPVLSRLRHDPVRMVSFLLRSQTLLLHVVAAILAISTAQAPGLITFVLGAQWTESAPIFQVLAAGGVAQAAGYPVYWMFLVSGKTSSLLKLELVIRPIMIGLILTGSLWGVYGVATGYALGQLLAWPVGLWWQRKGIVPVITVLFNGMRIIAQYAAAGFVSFFFTTAFLLPPITALALGAVIFCIMLAFMALTLPSYRADLVTFKQVVQAARRKAPSLE